MNRLEASQALCRGVSFLIQSPRQSRKLTARFFRTERGTEPVREWLRGLPPDDRKRVGEEIRKLQFGWPIGMPLVRKLGPDLWELRVRLDRRTARLMLTIFQGEAVLLHAFVKKSEKTPATEMNTALRRLGVLMAFDRRYH